MKNLNKKYQLPHHYNPITNREPKSIISEQYRKLRTNIDLSRFDQDLKVLLLTSTFALEGKTITSINLANVYSQSEKKTLLIDMDLRKPKIHHGYELSNKVGLSDLLIKKLNKNDAIQKVSPYLDVLTAGNRLPYPSEFLVNPNLKDFIELVKNDYDRIIIDSPPMIVPDASIISQYVDGVLLVIASRKTHIEAAKRAITELNSNGAKIIGSIFTQVPKRDNNYYNYKYQGKYE